MKRSSAYNSLGLLSLFLAALLLITVSHVQPTGSALAAQPVTRSQAAAGQMDKTATIYGVKIHYVEAGTGPAVILLHGLGGDLTNWAQTIGPLSQKHRVIAIDQVGFGKSDKPMVSYRVGMLVDFLDALYKELKIERASLVGNSLGGWTAAAYTLAYPQKVERLVLVDAAGFKLGPDLDTRQVNGLNPATKADMKALFSLIFYNKLYTSDAAIDQVFTRKMMSGDGYTIQQFINSVIREEDTLDGRLGAIKQPTLLVWGRQDGLTPVAIGERFKKEIAGSELLVIDQCGHVPQLEKAAEFNAALLKFLAAGESGI